MTLTWQVAGATSLSISPGIGAVTPTTSGSRSVSVTATTTFILTATNAGGSATASATASVAAADVQPPTATITSPGSGAFLTGTVTIQVNAQDNIGVSRVEMLVDGVVAGTDNAAPWEFTWDTDALNDGSRNLVARAYDAANNQGSSSVVSVTIRHPFVLTFRNLVHTDIALNVQGQSSPLTVPVGGTRTYTYTSNPGNVAFSGATSGRTTSGGQVGLLMTWSANFAATGLRSGTVDLFLSGTYFFVRVQNCGSLPLFDFYVNYGLVSETYDNISIPTDCQVKNIGYYRAFTNTQVRAYRTASLYVFWNQGTHFTLPFTNNQSVTLLNNIAGVAAASPPIDGIGMTGAAQGVPRAAELRDWLVANPAALQVAGKAQE